MRLAASRGCFVVVEPSSPPVVWERTPVSRGWKKRPLDAFTPTGIVCSSDCRRRGESLIEEGVEKEMGNCLKSPTSDDISLLHESQSDRASYGDGTDPDLEPPPPYQVTLTEAASRTICSVWFTSLAVFIVCLSVDDLFIYFMR